MPLCMSCHAHISESLDSVLHEGTLNIIVGHLQGCCSGLDVARGGIPRLDELGRSASIISSVSEGVPCSLSLSPLCSLTSIGHSEEAAFFTVPSALSACSDLDMLRHWIGLELSCACLHGTDSFAPLLALSNSDCPAVPRSRQLD